MSVDEMIHQILKAIDELEGEIDRDQWTDERWTRKIKSALCKVGKRNRYSVCASSVDTDKDHGEWLYDVCWLKYGENDGDEHVWLRCMPMAAECEWGNLGDIEDDFSKLLLARATLRVMVCNSGRLSDDSEGRVTAERLQQWVREFARSQVGDTYLLIIYKNLESRRYRLDVTRAVELTPLEGV